VDVPLADLFLHAAAQFISTPEGHAHARSATEAFLYRRLQTLPLTRGRFKLNARLPIQFDDRGEMEIDLLDAEARLAVELDGPQHLADPVAYRRDRRKDLLLQESGYLVVRFLTGDVSKRLSDVLDTLTHILVSRATRQ
jgi:very-short-patch-repair endonuclease